MTDSFITQAEEALTRFDDPDQGGVIWAFALATALRSLLGEYKRLTAEQAWIFTYMDKDGYEDDYAGLPAMSIEYAKWIRDQYPGKGRIYKTQRMPWVPVEGEDQ